MGAGAGPGSERDPFEQLLNPDFAQSAEYREPSAEERAAAVAAQKAAARKEREADLRRRLAEQAVHDDEVAKRERRARRRNPTRIWKVLGILTAVVAALAFAWMQTRGSVVAVGDSRTSVRPADYPPVDDSVSDSPLGTPPPAPLDPGPYEFVQMQQDGSGPIAWDPCRPIRYVVNPSGAPAGAEQLLEQAVANTAAATGFQFVDSGTTDEPWTKQRDAYQPDRYDDRWAPVLISWETQNTVPDIAGYIAGLGGGTPRSDSSGRAAYVSGAVVLDAEDLDAMLLEPDGTTAARAVIQHELGHLVGLDHVADASQLMFTEGTPAQTGDWGTDDLAGLNVLGSQPCMPEL